jgi:hypothetical protein
VRGLQNALCVRGLQNALCVQVPAVTTVAMALVKCAAPSGSLQRPMFLQYSDSSATGSAAQMGQNMANIVKATWRCADSPSIFSSRIVLPSTARSFNHLEFFAPGRIQLQLYLQNSAGRSHPLVCRFFLACDVGGMPCALHDIMFFYHSQSVRTATIHPLCKSPSTAC